ncbi:TetR/AcrR family transcriptional regulator [Archangium gephyra]|nr:TetR/AcrR family transcriptional regulator [Archangium gephyra]
MDGDEEAAHGVFLGGKRAATHVPKYVSFQKEINSDLTAVKPTSVVMGRPKEVTDEQIVAAARRCFIKRGAGVSAADIARELGVSHTTLFNRFGSKEGLMLAALGPPKELPWVAALDAGPDERPIREQLVEHAKEMSAYFQDLQAGLGVLQAAGIEPSKAYRAREGESPPMQAFRALVAWLERAQSQKRLARCETDTLASTLLGALHGWAFTARVCGESTSAAASERYVERFIELLWNGIGNGKA